MSAEIVEGPNGMYVVIGDPKAGYDIRPVGAPIARYQRKYLACHDIHTGAVNATLDAYVPDDWYDNRDPSWGDQ